MTPRRRRLVHASVLSVFVLTIAACILLPDFRSQKVSGKYEPVHHTTGPSKRAADPVAEKQTEPHTCGLHAMRSLYAAYGLDPDVMRLRFRLGTDEPATRVEKGSTGTLHPDLYRVLTQDGFVVKPIDLARPEAEQTLLDHLGDGQLALALVYRSTYHWVLLGHGGRDGELVVYDSLVDTAQVTRADTAIADALSVSLVGPASEQERLDTTQAHTQGLAEMRRVFQRK